MGAVKAWMMSIEESLDACGLDTERALEYVKKEYPQTSLGDVEMVARNRTGYATYQ